MITLEKNKLLFDVGANIGNKCIPFIDKGYRVVLIEPQSKCIDVLKMKFGLSPNVKIEQCVIGPNIQMIDFYECKDASTISSCSTDWIKQSRFAQRNSAWSHPIKIQQKTIDSLIDKYGVPSIIKIDVEGYEYEVLQGLTQSIDLIYFEFSIEFFDKLIHCIDYIKSLGSYEFTYSIGENNHWEHEFILNSDYLLEKIKSEDYKYNDIWGTWGDFYCRLMK
jgi:FkbM family methyltransferase